jgi:hypothetical protein
MTAFRAFVLFVIATGLTSCATTSSHQFATATPAWKTRAGQLAYRGPQMSLIGEVLVRTSPAGDMELTFSKAPALTLMTIRQDAQFASAEGPLARGRWAGATASAPERLRGWFALREKILTGGSSVQLTNGGESFNLRF